MVPMRKPIQFAAGTVLILGLSSLVLLVETTRAEKDAKAATYPVVEKPTHEGYRETIPDTKVGFEMLPIPAGAYLMGSRRRRRGAVPTRGRNTPSGSRRSGWASAR